MEQVILGGLNSASGSSRRTGKGDRKGKDDGKSGRSEFQGKGNDARKGKCGGKGGKPNIGRNANALQGKGGNGSRKGTAYGLVPHYYGFPVAAACPPHFFCGTTPGYDCAPLSFAHWMSPYGFPVAAACPPYFCGTPGSEYSSLTPFFMRSHLQMHGDLWQPAAMDHAAANGAAGWPSNFTAEGRGEAQLAHEVQNDTAAPLQFSVSLIMMDSTEHVIDEMCSSDSLMTLLLKAQKVIGDKAIHLVHNGRNLCRSSVDMTKSIADLDITSRSSLRVVCVQMPREWHYNFDSWFEGHQDETINRVLLESDGTCANIVRVRSDYDDITHVKLGTYGEEGTTVTITWTFQVSLTHGDGDWHLDLEGGQGRRCVHDSSGFVFTVSATGMVIRLDRCHSKGDRDYGERVGLSDSSVHSLPCFLAGLPELDKFFVLHQGEFHAE